MAHVIIGNGYTKFEGVNNIYCPGTNTNPGKGNYLVEDVLIKGATGSALSMCNSNIIRIFNVGFTENSRDKNSLVLVGSNNNIDVRQCSLGSRDAPSGWHMERYANQIY